MTKKISYKAMKSSRPLSAWLELDPEDELHNHVVDLKKKYGKDIVELARKHGSYSAAIKAIENGEIGGKTNEKAAINSPEKKSKPEIPRKQSR